MEPPRARTPQAVLFACAFNAVRSPMAESLLQKMFPQALYVKSAGVRKGDLDPFAVAVMAELGQDISKHRPMTFEDLDDWEGLNFDLIISLSPEAHHKALELTRTMAVEVEYWSRAIANRSSKPIAKCATGWHCAFASDSRAVARRAGKFHTLARLSAQAPSDTFRALSEGIDPSHARPHQTRSRVRLAAASQPAQSGRHRA
jgi:protein-tyrosine-phosphatase